MLRIALKRLRSELAVSQTQLAQMLNVSFTTINRWENGRVVPNAHLATMVMNSVRKMDVSPSCIDYLERALFPDENDDKMNKIRRLDMNMAGSLVDNSSNGIFVADCETYELLYVNETMDKMRKRAGIAITSYTCYGYLHGRTSPCPQCKLYALSQNEFRETEFLSETGKHYLLRGKLLNWEGRQAHVEYVSDESAMLENQSIVRDISNNVPAGLGIYHVCPDTSIKLFYLNDGFFSLIGETRESWEQRKNFDVFSLIEIEQREELLRKIHQAVANHAAIAMDVNFSRSNGEKIWLHLDGIAAEKGEEKTTIYLVLTNVNEKKQLEDSLTKHATALTQAVECGKTAFWTYDIKSRQLTQLGHNGNAFGYEQIVENVPESVIQSGIIYPDDRDVYAEAYEKIIKGSPLQEWTMRLKNLNTGAYLWMRCTLTRQDISLEKTIVTGFMFDVNAESNQIIEQQKLLSLTPGGMHSCYLGNPIHLESASTGLCQLLGYTQDEFAQAIGTRYTLAIVPEDRDIFRNFVQKLASEPSQKTAEYRMIKKDGTEIQVSDTMQSFIGSDGVMHGYSSITDVTKLKMNEQKIIAEAKLLKEKEERLYDVIHHIPGGICLYRWDGKKVEPLIVSKECSLLHGVEDMMNIDAGVPFQYVHPDDVDELRALMRSKVHQSNDDFHHRYRFWNPKRKKYIWISAHVKSIMQDNGILLVYICYTDVSEEMAMQKTLEETQTITDMACSFADMWVFNCDLEKHICYPNRRLQQEFGFPEHVTNFPEAVFEYQLILPEYVPIYRDAFCKLQNGADIVDFDIQTKLIDNNVHWVRFKGQRLPGTDEALAVFSAQVIDIEKAAEARIALERKQIQGNEKNLLFYYISDVLTGEVLEYKGLYEEKHLDTNGITIEEIFQRGENDLYYVDDRTEFRRIHNQSSILSMYKNGEMQKEWDVLILSPSGDLIWAKDVMHLIFDPQMKQLLLYEYVYNIDVERMTSELMGSILGNLYEACGSLYLKKGQYTNLTIDQNSGQLSAQSVSFAQNVQHYADTLVHPDDRDEFLQRCTPEAILKGAKEKSNYVVRTIEDGKIHFKRYRAVLWDEDRAVCFLTRADITELIAKEENAKSKLSTALELAQKADKAKTEFLARMSHDMRTPMNTVLGLIALMKNEKDLPNLVEDGLAKIKAASEIMVGLVNDILNQMMIDDGTIVLQEEPYRYADFLFNMKTIFEPMCKAKGIQFDFEDVTTAVTVLVDRERMNQVFFHILSNAIKFTPSGGRIAYYTDRLKIENGYVSADYYIQDTGIGMSEEFQKTMFESFSQEDTHISPEYHGSGLGLGYAKKLVELMGGELSVYSKKGIGTTVRIHLRSKLASQTAKLNEIEPASIATDENILSGKNILIAEDHPLNAQILIKILEKKGMYAVHVGNGEEAVACFAEREKGYFAAILMDIRMPVMNGLEATAKIRNMNREDAKIIPIIAVTANAYDADKEQSQRAGLDAHLAKPIVPELLYKTLAEYISLNTLNGGVDDTLETISDNK